MHSDALLPHRMLHKNIFYTSTFALAHFIGWKEFKRVNNGRKEINRERKRGRGRGIKGVWGEKERKRGSEH